jgi:hypothetical protein
VAKIKNMGVVEGQTILSSNDWEDVKKGGHSAIEAWIRQGDDGQVVRCRAHWGEHCCPAVGETRDQESVGGRTRPRGSPHPQPDRPQRRADCKGANPFSAFTVDGKNLDSIVKAYDPPHKTSGNVYDHIKGNLPDWVE